MLDNRKHLRIRGSYKARWKLVGTDISGEGTIYNISRSGALFQTEHIFKINDKPVICLESIDDELVFKSKQGKVVWFRREKTPHASYLMGILFSTDSMADKKFIDWLESKIQETSNAQDANILGHYIR